MRPPLLILILSFLLLFNGVALPFLMIIKLLTPSFFLAFLAYFSSIAGLILGLIAIAYYYHYRP